MHGLRHDVLAQHRSERRLAVTTARVRRRAGALQVELTTVALAIDELAEQQRPTVTEAAREAAELVPGVRLGDRRRAIGQSLSDQRGEAGGAAERSDVEAQLGGQRLVEHDQPRLRERGRIPTGGEALEVPERGALQRQGERRDHRSDAMGCAIRSREFA
jgi:hypothetical protein